MMRSLLLTRFRTQLCRVHTRVITPLHLSFTTDANKDSKKSTSSNDTKSFAESIFVSQNKTEEDTKTSACSDDSGDVDDDEMEQEEMFVDADESLGHNMPEWGGPRRGGRFPEPTRFGDWERKGRCTDF